MATPRKTEKKSNKAASKRVQKPRPTAEKKEAQKSGMVESKGFGLRLMDNIQNEGTVHYRLVAHIEALTKRNLVSYSSFFAHPAGIIDDDDPRMIETLLKSIDLSKYPGTLDLMINSPGGSPTAAEKIVLTCRAYATSFRVIVPQSAMSAATMVAMGADTILFTPTSEIGPIDPQMVQRLPNGAVVVRSAKAHIDAYRELVGNTQAAIKSNEPPHPFIELLRRIDPPWIQECLKARQLAAKIAAEFLSRWMLSDKTTKEVDETVQRFVEEGDQGSHGRAIRAEKAKEFGLAGVEVAQVDGDLWMPIWELHERCQRYVQSKGLAKYVAARNGGINVQAQLMQIS